MVRKRSAFDPLERSTAPHWHVVRNMQGTLIESRPVAPGTDLKRLFVELLLQSINAGWEIGEFSSTSGTFFCTRYPERHMVSIVPSDPHEEPRSMYGPSPGR
jgi:hypothetical protein